MKLIWSRTPKWGARYTFVIKPQEKKFIQKPNFIVQYYIYQSDIVLFWFDCSMTLNNRRYTCLRFQEMFVCQWSVKNWEKSAGWHQPSPRPLSEKLVWPLFAGVNNQRGYQIRIGQKNADSMTQILTQCSMKCTEKDMWVI